MANESSTSLPTVPDVQSGLPATQVSLSRVGVTGVEKVIRVRDGDRENLFYAEMECFVDLEPKQAGVHMSRFEEIVGEAIDEVVLGEAFKAEILAAHVAQKVREGQSFAATLLERKVVPDVAIKMIEVGESTGALQEMLNSLADFYDEEVDAAVSGLLAALEPIMIVFLGLVVGGMVVAMYLPIFDMINAVQ